MDRNNLCCSAVNVYDRQRHTVSPVLNESAETSTATNDALGNTSVNEDNP